MTGIIGAYRTVLLNQPADWRALGFSIGFAIVVFVIGVLVFHRTERRVADVA
jgi:ABC-type polysaccharide/polyol phosphate export permease